MIDIKAAFANVTTLSDIIAVHADHYVTGVGASEVSRFALYEALVERAADGRIAPGDYSKIPEMEQVAVKAAAAQHKMDVPQAFRLASRSEFTAPLRLAATKDDKGNNVGLAVARAILQSAKSPSVLKGAAQAANQMWKDHKRFPSVAEVPALVLETSNKKSGADRSGKRSGIDKRGALTIAKAVSADLTSLLSKVTGDHVDVVKAASKGIAHVQAQLQRAEDKAKAVAKAEKEAKTAAKATAKVKAAATVVPVSSNKTDVTAMLAALQAAGFRVSPPRSPKVRVSTHVKPVKRGKAKRR